MAASALMAPDSTGPAIDADSSNAQSSGATKYASLCGACGASECTGTGVGGRSGIVGGFVDWVGLVGAGGLVCLIGGGCVGAGGLMGATVPSP